MTDRTLVLGLDYGTDSARALLIDAKSGETLGTAVAPYKRWAERRWCEPDRDQYRQHPQDYIDALEEAVAGALSQGGEDAGARVAGLSFDTTGSTPCMVGEDGVPLALKPEFAEDPDAMFVLWKDHTATKEAARINELNARSNTDYLRYVGGIYSSEWGWAKVAHVLGRNDRVADAAVSFVEHCDWMPALLTGQEAVRTMPRGRCAAGHKNLWADEWDGLPDESFLTAIEPRLKGYRDTFARETLTSDKVVGHLTPEWAERLGLSRDAVVGAGAFDCHMGAVGGEIRPRALSRVIGTSTCDIMIVREDELGTTTVAGICGQVDGSVVPGMVGLEAGQSAFGDLYAWFAELLSWPLQGIKPGAGDAGHTAPADLGPGRVIAMLSEAAEKVDPTTSELVAIDWLNGRRTPDANQELRGAIAGLSLGADAPRVFRTLVEASCFGSRAIVERIRREGVAIDEVIGLGGVAQKSPLVMQTMADVLNMPIRVARAEQTCALGAAMFASIAAGLHASTGDAQAAMGQGFEAEYTPNPKMTAHYDRVYEERYKPLGAFVEDHLT
ncbi:ribulokinase [Parvularcula dongshanensis]|uniref:L-ribulokinase n=1 Tax=Parvularcula dongshanensis TaxID=1173995 RepID=A0A840I7M3_9PROT|nr:ribulokinase [Parvularcula dongshanensis]MBB4659960.1 L-ribulokinase [Parvularcula dongshanensis]